MAQKNRANMLTDIVSNIYNNLINFITGQNAQDRFVNLLDSSPNILSDKDQASGYVGTDANNEMLSGYYIEQLSVVAAQTLIAGSDLVSLKAYLLDDADAGNRIIKVLAAAGVTNQFYQYGIDATTGEIGTYDINTDVFTPIVSSAQTLAQTLVLGNTSGAKDIEFDATQGLLFANTSRLREGTIDAGLGGLKGIAQICGAGYELKWENGRLYVMGSSGNTIRQSLYNLTTTPTATDDTTLGYAVGSLWTLDDGTVYVCSDATATAAVWAIGGIPNLQQVTTVGATTTNSISITNGTGSVNIQPNQIKITNAIGYGTIGAANLTADPNFELPNKATGTYTFAMLSDITGGTGDVVGPASAVSNNVVFFNGTTGKLIKDSGLSLSGTNTGNETTSTLGATINGAAAATPNDTDLVATVESSVVKKITWTNVKTFLSTYFNGIYQAILTAANMHTFVDSLNAMTTPADADRFLIVDNSTSLAKKITWANIKATLKTYFDSLTTTLTNKRITARAGTVVSDATPTINTDNVDFFSITGQTVDITNMSTNLTGTPTEGQTLWIAITGTAARAITWGTSFEASTIALPTTTVTTARLDVAFIYNTVTSKWRCVGVA